MLKYLIFDLDNTLYSARYGLEDNVEQRLKKFTADFLGVSGAEAWRERKAAKGKYGTCLEWLMAEKGFTDIEAYLAAAHPEGEADALPRDDDLREFLSGIKMPKAILTNAPKEHADLILDKLGIPDLFTHIFDIRINNFVGKPRRDVFENALNTLGVQAFEVLFIDDVPSYAEGFADIGGKALLFDEDNVHKKCCVPKIRDLREIIRYIGRGA
ncbi:MAG: HAD-IA family hydrolase [Treponema sp.]|nr:HAD-IA family hydrolase [Treponema sp.]